MSVELTTREGVTYPTALFKDIKSEDINTFLKETENDFIVYDFKLAKKEKSGEIINEAIILKPSIKNGYKAFEKIYFSPHHDKFKNIKSILEYDNKETMIINTECCSYSVESLWDILGFHSIFNNKKSNISRINFKTIKPRTRSLVYDNIDIWGDLESFKKARILEFEGMRGYPLKMKQALDYVFKLLVDKNYNFSPMAALHEASKTYGIHWKDLQSGNSSRMNLRRTCTRMWNNR